MAPESTQVPASALVIPKVVRLPGVIRPAKVLRPAPVPCSCRVLVPVPLTSRSVLMVKACALLLPILGLPLMPASSN